MTLPLTHAFLDGPSVAVPHDPAAPVVDLGGRTTAVGARTFDIYPSTLEATREIWLRGVWVPGPIRNPQEFRWPSVVPDFDPMDHQVQTADFITVYPRSFVLNRPGCVDAATEYLSPTGWRRIDAYDGGEVMQYNKDTQVASFVQPTDYIRKPAAGFWYFKNDRGLDQMLSPGHRMLVDKQMSDGRGNNRREVAVHTAQEMAARARASSKGRLAHMRVPNAFLYGGPGLDLSDDDLRVAVMTKADGYVENANTGRVVLRLKKQRKILRARRLLSRAMLDVNERPCRSSGFTVFSYTPRYLEGDARKTYAPVWYGASARQLAIVGEEAPLWDGTERKGGGEGFYTRSRSCADFIQFAMSARGRTCSLNVHANLDGEPDDYVVHARAGSTPYGISAPKKVDTPEGTEQFCFAVPDTFLVLRRNGQIFITGNTGKTASSIWSAEYLISKGLIDKVLIICPKSCMEDVWVNELRALNPLRRVAVAHGSSRTDALKGNFEYVIANHDQCRFEPFKSIAAQWQTDHRLLVIVDEATAFKNYRSARTRGLEKMTNQVGKTWLWMMTGTPHPKDPTDIYGMCKVLNPASVPRTFKIWQDRVMYKVDDYKYKPRPEAGTHIRKAMWPAICFKSEDVLELPPRYEYGFGASVVPGSEWSPESVPLTDQQQDLMDQLRKRAVAEMAQLAHEKKRGNIVAVHAGALRTKLFQIAQGVVIDEHQMPRFVDCRPRLDHMMEQIAKRKKKFLVFSHYKSVLQMLTTELNRAGLRCDLINGGTAQGKRKKTLEGVRRDPGVHGLCAQPGTMAHGITLVEADTTFWWGPPSNPEYWDQGNHRVYRKGQKDPVHIYAQATCKEEANYFNVLIERGDLEQATLDMFKPR